MKIRNAYEKNSFLVIVMCDIVRNGVGRASAQYSRPDVLDG